MKWILRGLDNYLCAGETGFSSGQGGSGISKAMNEAAAAAARRGQRVWTAFEALLDMHVAAPNRDGERLESLHLDDGLSVSASEISVVLDLAWGREMQTSPLDMPR
jgi:hypothetical protein